MKKNVCESLKKIRNDLGFSMAKMAKTLNLSGVSTYQYYEDSKIYKKDYFDPAFLNKLIEKLVPLGIEKEKILEMGGTKLESPLYIKDTDIAFSYILKALINEITTVKSSAKQSLQKEFLSALNHLHQSEIPVPGAIEVMSELLEHVSETSHLRKLDKMRQLLQLSPAGSA